MKFHKLTALFARNLYDRITLVNHNWADNYSFIQKLESKQLPGLIKDVLPLDNLYYNFNYKPTNKIAVIYDDNNPANFLPLIKKDVEVRKAIKSDVFDTKSQANPDNIFNFKNSQFKDKRIHGMDAKAYEKPVEFESRIFSQITKENYSKGLDAIYNLIITNEISINSKQLIDIKEALDNLAQTSQDLISHQLTWAENLHLFPKQFIPPMRIPRNFSTEDLKPEVIQILQKSNLVMRKVSDLLYLRKIPENDMKKAIELFKDSEMQKILNQ